MQKLINLKNQNKIQTKNLTKVNQPKTKTKKKPQLKINLKEMNKNLKSYKSQYQLRRKQK